MKVGLLTIGDEILIGQTIDTNASYIAQQINQAGYEIEGKITVQDSREGITEGLNYLIHKVDLILATGGLGPTKDDITKKVVSEYLGLEMVFNQEVFDTIKSYFERFGRKITELHRLQAYMPQGVTLFSNKLGTAPGMWLEKDRKYLCFMPGVPYEMKYLLENHVLPKITYLFPSNILHRTFHTAGAGETQLAEMLTPVIKQLPEHFSVAYLPDLGKVRIRVSARGENKEALNEELEYWFNRMEGCISSFIYGYDNVTLPEALGNLLLEKGLTVGTAESCTGGLIGHKIIEPAGASQYYLGSLVTYSYELKTSLLGVENDTLIDYGAVSEETVLAMLSGLFKVLSVDIGVAVSGIAGPDGGTPDKPVGTIWIAYGSKEKMKTLKIQASKHRKLNIQYAAHVAINLLIKFLKHN